MTLIKLKDRLGRWLGESSTGLASMRLSFNTQTLQKSPMTVFPPGDWTQRHENPQKLSGKPALCEQQQETQTSLKVEPASKNCPMIAIYTHNPHDSVFTHRCVPTTCHTCFRAHLYTCMSRFFLLF